MTDRPRGGHALAVGIHMTSAVKTALPLLFLAATITTIGSLAATQAGCSGAIVTLVPNDGGPDQGNNPQPDGADPVTPVSKVDLLFVVDNSRSMGPKQEILRTAVPELVARLVSPNCVDAQGHFVARSVQGACSAGSLEFKPITDLHVGVLSSSLGGLGSDACPPNATNQANTSLNAHNDDAAHLLNRAGADEHVIPDAAPFNFLAYASGPAANAASAVPIITSPDTLTSEFQDLVAGVHQYGCGFEAQLESLYRFLIQPDPYQTLTRNTDRVRLNGVDETLLQQRQAFLRPDSAVAVIMLTDENESTVDPMSLGGQGWAWENSGFPNSPNGAAPKGTDTCATNPTDSACTSCALVQDPDDRAQRCTTGDYFEPSEENLNTRFFQMRRRFGFDPMFPISRYVKGLTDALVPNREGEHPAGSGAYVGTAECTNPLFAAALPTSASEELCKLPRGTRRTGHVYFAIIGGVSPHLLRVDPNDPTSAVKDTLTEADWTKIIGKDPLGYDFAGADPHMLESTTPRAGLPGVTASVSADPVHGREFTTGGEELQYACTFALPTPLNCLDAKNAGACDCSRDTDSPLCDPVNRKMQMRGAAYPSIRQLAVARELGNRAIVSSICPSRTTEATAGDPLYGYRPAMSAVIERLRTALAK